MPNYYTKTGNFSNKLQFNCLRGGKNVSTEELNGHHFARWWHFLKYSMVIELVFFFNMIIDYCEF